MASFEPRGLGIKKEVYSRKSYSGVSVSIGIISKQAPLNTGT